MEKNAYRYIYVPVVILIGIFVSGTLIEGLFNVPNAAVKLFGVIGGLTVIGLYFRSRIDGRHF